MPELDVRFTNCGALGRVVDEDDEWMQATLSFALVLDGNPVGNFHANAKQTQGASWGEDDWEVEGPVDDHGASYAGTIPHQAFADDDQPRAVRSVRM